MDTITAVVLMVLVLGVGVGLLASPSVDALPLPFRQRSCQGGRWRLAFAEAPKQDIRRFLSVFVSAFGFETRDRLKLGPDDEILGIYRALYPREAMADGMEVEDLEDALKREYGLDLAGVWHARLTLGELFARARDAGGRTARG